MRNLTTSPRCLSQRTRGLPGSPRRGSKQVRGLTRSPSWVIWPRVVFDHFNQEGAFSEYSLLLHLAFSLIHYHSLPSCTIMPLLARLLKRLTRNRSRFTETQEVLRSPTTIEQNGASARTKLLRGHLKIPKHVTVSL